MDVPRKKSQDVLGIWFSGMLRPLPDRYSRNHPIHQMRGGVRHSPATAGRAKPPIFSGKRKQAVFTAGITMQTKEAMLQYPAFQKRSEFLFPEPR
jgi:hypothetical protein